MQKKVTYLFGAGASHGTIPLVKELHANFYDIYDNLGKILEEFKINSDIGPDQINAVAGIEGLFKWMYEESAYHPSIDTFAKKLSLKNDKRLADLKYTLSLFFAIKQAMAKVNMRYDGFFASLLKNNLNGDIEFPEEIKIITWNYDAQVELTASSYFDANTFSDLQKYFATYPSPTTSNRPPHIVHLNGLAGIYETNKIVDLVFSYKDRRYTLKEIIEKISYTRSSHVQGAINFDNTLTFSWENKKYDGQGLKIAQEILRKTDILVIVGYSFPFFNRVTDRNLLSAFQEVGTEKKIYFQNPNMESDFLRPRFNLGNNIIIPPSIKEGDHIYIPEEL